MHVQEWVWEAFGIDKPSEEVWSDVMEADNQVLLVEAHNICGDEDLYAVIASSVHDDDDDDGGLSEREVISMGEEIDQFRGLYESMYDFRNAFEELMISVYDEEILRENYDPERADYFGIPSEKDEKVMSLKGITGKA